MFTGIVEELGEVVRLDLADESARITVRGPLVTADAGQGSSIAVNGVCLTVVGLDPAAGTFAADVMPATLQRSSLGALVAGSVVNLERPVPAGGRLGGHVVQGHVDGVGAVLDRTPGDRWELVRIELPDALARYLVPQGSIAVDGISLTVSALDEHSFTVSLIPETLTRTTLGRRQPGEPVNLEVDVLAKYVERLVAVARPQEVTP
jgi:riboflavin synthase